MKKSKLFKKYIAFGIFFAALALYSGAHEEPGVCAIFTVISLLSLWLPFMLPNEEKYEQPKGRINRTDW